MLNRDNDYTVSPQGVMHLSDPIREKKTLCGVRTGLQWKNSRPALKACSHCIRLKIAGENNSAKLSRKTPKCVEKRDN